MGDRELRTQAMPLMFRLNEGLKNPFEVDGSVLQDVLPYPAELRVGGPRATDSTRVPNETTDES